MAKILIPLPARDFDPTEVAVPWQVLSARGHDVVFATPAGEPGAADELMLSGRGLDPWGFLPLVRNITLVGGVLRADANARAAYAKLIAAPAFRTPLAWADLRAENFARAGKPMAAICHGVVLLARSIDPATGKSVLHGRKTTALTWRLERSAAALARVTRFWDPHYYRTYLEQRGQPAGFMSVEAEVTRALASPADFQDVAAGAPKRKNSGLARDSAADGSPAFVVRDGNYVSARWPGDAHTFAATFAELFA